MRPEECIWLTTGVILDLNMQYPLGFAPWPLFSEFLQHETQIQPSQHEDWEPGKSTSERAGEVLKITFEKTEMFNNLHIQIKTG